MGILRSFSDCTGMTVDGVLLAVPDFTDDLGWDEVMFSWSDRRIPSGVIGDDGVIVLDGDPDA